MRGTTESAQYFDGAEAPDRGAASATSFGILRILRELALQDWVLLTYQTTLVLLVLAGERGATYQPAVRAMTGLLIAAVFGVLFIRSGWIARNVAHGAKLEAVAYGVYAIGVVEGSYSFFRETLPQINPESVDLTLYNLDLMLFGAEPAVLWEGHVTGPLTEWFSLAYIGYFLLLSSFVLPILFWAGARPLAAEFGLAAICIFTLGHLTYTLVPGFGPFRGLSEVFQGPLPSGYWYDLQQRIVAVGGAQKDIFPSIHTAVPTFLTGFAFRHRNMRPFRWVWPIVAFFAVNIVIATLYLRWHYLIDVVAGLAYGSLGLAIRSVSSWETERREAQGLRPSWPSFS
jgi:membrane-associated phospholipid phosphatase